ncbi:MAG TPA: hypothetical protein VF826_12575 [Chloroflexia bacterium]|jgi:hypothetical protein
MKHTALSQYGSCRCINAPPGPKPQRFVWLDRLEWKDGQPGVPGPTTSPQPVP